MKKIIEKDTIHLKGTAHHYDHRHLSKMETKKIYKL